MAGDVRITVKDGGVLRALDNLAQFTRDARPLLERIGNDIASETELAFADSRSPFGETWKPLAKSTIAGRRKKSDVPLVDSGTLKNSIQSQIVGPYRVEIGTALRYARIHNEGGTINFPPRSFLTRLRKTTVDGKTRVRFAKDSQKRVVSTARGTNSSGWSVTIPQRQFLPIDRLPPRYEAMIRAAIGDAVFRVFGERGR